MPTTRFSLVVSMSHLIGDGATFYKVHNMLSSAAEPTAIADGAKASGESETVSETAGK